MSSINKAILIGNLGKDPEFKTLQHGGEVCSFSVATSTQWKDKSSGEQKSQTEWHKIVCFNEPLIKVCKAYLKKGSKVYVEGKIQTRSYLDKGDKTIYVTEIVLNDFSSKIVLLDKSEKSEETYSPQKTYFDKNKFELDDEIPF